MTVFLRNRDLYLEVLPALGGCVVRFDALTSILEGAYRLERRTATRAGNR